MPRKRPPPSGTPIHDAEHGLLCPRCGRARARCECAARDARAAAAARAPTDGVVRVARQTQGRKGKGVTVVRGLPLAASELAALAKRLKARCGAGGRVVDGAIEIQGEHRDELVELLRSEGFTVKRAGG